MKLILPIVFILLSLVPVKAQWDVPVRIELNGASPGDRQITGLADPTTADAASSYDATRALTMAYATATGSNQLSADLDPAPTAYSPGMAVTIVPSAANEANASLELNGLGAIPIVKWGALPLDSADLLPNVPARLVFDGIQFQLISTSYRACPVGYRAVGADLCVSEQNFGSSTFFEAVEYCRDRNARLCTFSEWIQACRTGATFISTVEAGEWVDHAANNAGDAKQMGYGSTGSGDGDPFNVPSCQHGRSADPISQGRIRCCKNR